MRASCRFLEALRLLSVSFREDETRKGPEERAFGGIGADERIRTSTILRPPAHLGVAAVVILGVRGGPWCDGDPRGPWVSPHLVSSTGLGMSQ